MADMKIGWDKDLVKGPELEPGLAEAVGVYRKLKVEFPNVAVLFRTAIEEGRLAKHELAVLKRQVEEGKAAGGWDKFVAPFVKLKPKELDEWVATFKADVAQRRAEAKALGMVDG